MSVLCDRNISDLIRKGMIDFDRSETDWETVQKQINPNTLDLTLGKFIQWPKETQMPLVFGRPYQLGRTLSYSRYFLPWGGRVDSYNSPRWYQCRYMGGGL